MTTLNPTDDLVIEVAVEDCKAMVAIKHGSTIVESYGTVSDAIRESAVQSLYAEMTGELEVAADCKAIALALMRFQLEAGKPQG